VRHEFWIPGDEFRAEVTSVLMERFNRKFFGRVAACESFFEQGRLLMNTPLKIQDFAALNRTFMTSTATQSQPDVLNPSISEIPPSLSVGKRVVDFFGSILLLLLLSPFLLIVASMVRKSGNPIIFSQVRVGRNGRLFRCYKFRTMVPNAESVLTELLASNPEMKAEWELDHKLRNDPRITPIGAFLRKTSLDELPQLFNVLKGEMSLIGPRPIVTSELSRYRRSIRWYHAVRPGMTGLWQVSGRNDTDYNRRVALDAFYVRNQSFLMDISILIKTIRVVLFRSGAY